MSHRAQRLIEAARKLPVPEGTYAVGLGLLISGITAYGFQILAFKGLTKSESAAPSPHSEPSATIRRARPVAPPAPGVVHTAAAPDARLWSGPPPPVPPLLPALVSLRGQRRLLEPGPDAEWSELSTNLTLLFLGS